LVDEGEFWLSAESNHMNRSQIVITDIYVCTVDPAVPNFERIGLRHPYCRHNKVLNDY